MSKSFGQYLKEKRLKSGMNICELSSSSGISAAQISRIENGKRGVPKPATLKKISYALNLNYEELMIRAGYLETKNGSKNQIEIRV